MNRILLMLLLAFVTVTATAQGTVKGKVLDKSHDEALEFINVTVSQRGQEKILKGAITDVNGHFNITGLANGNYTLRVSFTGYKDVVRQFSITNANPTRSFAAIYLSEDAHALEEVTVTGQRSEMKLEVDRKTFNVDQQIANAGGSASEVLENIPSVEVDQDGNISLRGNESVEVWINGKASGLTTDNRGEILQQMPAESIERIEVIDNPSAKFSAEGSAGIINIVLKKDRRAGYYGSVQAGANTRGGGNTSFNINYNSSVLDAYANIGYRHRRNKGGGVSNQTYSQTQTYQNYNRETINQGNNLFSRAGLTWHATSKDDISLSGMMMQGGRKGYSYTPYHYGSIDTMEDSYMMFRKTKERSRSHMYHGELTFRHNFTNSHFLDISLSYNKWKSDNDNFYQDSTMYYQPAQPTTYSYQYRPQFINNRTWEAKVDYENPITEQFKLQAGYNGRFSHENTPQESYIDGSTWLGTGQQEDKEYYNRFIYDMDVHALYATATYNFGKFGLMAGLRGEYWKVDTKSYDWMAEHELSDSNQPTAFKKDYFQLFPSVFMSWQLTPTQQLQLNYTRRLRRPWGGQLNSFKNTRDATVISYGNPELTPEYSNSFSLNYLKQWTQHSLLVSAYYRPTTDVMQRINYQDSNDGMMYQTNFNVSKSTSTGLEVTAKNKLWRILDLTSNVNLYYYQLDGFDFEVPSSLAGASQTVKGEGNHNFTWNARVQASLMLPYDISVQSTVRYRSRQVITQGYRRASYGLDMGVRKSFFNKNLVFSVNCRDVLNSRSWKTYTSSETFTRNQKNWRNSRSVNFTLTWNFGNMKQKRRPNGENRQDEEDNSSYSDYSNDGGE